MIASILDVESPGPLVAPIQGGHWLLVISGGTLVGVTGRTARFGGFTLALVSHLVVRGATFRAILFFFPCELVPLEVQQGAYLWFSLDCFTAVTAFLLHSSPYICTVNPAGCSSSTPFSG